jgi:hypothetical protein
MKLNGYKSVYIISVCSTDKMEMTDPNYIIENK